MKKMRIKRLRTNQQYKQHWKLDIKVSISKILIICLIYKLRSNKRAKCWFSRQFRSPNKYHLHLWKPKLIHSTYIIQCLLSLKKHNQRKVKKEGKGVWFRNLPWLGSSTLQLQKMSQWKESLLRPLELVPSQHWDIINLQLYFSIKEWEIVTPFSEETVQKAKTTPLSLFTMTVSFWILQHQRKNPNEYIIHIIIIQLQCLAWASAKTPLAAAINHLLIYWNT